MFSQSNLFPGHEIQTDFDCNNSVDVTVVFFDIYKVFDNVLHDSFIFKLK